jgi:hypothetical protein
VTLDGIVFSAVRYRYHSVWASVLTHWFNNTFGFIAFFFVGPITGSGKRCAGHSDKHWPAPSTTARPVLWPWNPRPSQSPRSPSSS